MNKQKQGFGPMRLDLSKAAWALSLAMVWACGTSDDEGVAQDDIHYDGACTKDDCADLTRPETNCTDTAPLFTCGAAGGGACAISFTCPDASDPGAAVSMSPCADSECGAKPTTAAEAGCAAGQTYTSSACGKLNGSSTCKWQNGCVTPGTPIPVDQSKIGAECGLDADGGTIQCEAGADCVTLPFDTGVVGAHCVIDPCTAITCPTDGCGIATSYPGQVFCGE